MLCSKLSSFVLETLTNIRHNFCSATMSTIILANNLNMHSTYLFIKLPYEYEQKLVCCALFDNLVIKVVCITDESATIRVTNLSEDTRESDLQELFRPFGPIQRIYLAKDKNTGQSKV